MALIVDREDDPLTRRKKAEALTEELRASITALMDRPEAAAGLDR